MLLTKLEKQHQVLKYYLFDQVCNVYVMNKQIRFF